MILQALDRYYDRMAARGEAEEPGWARVGVEWTIVLSRNGEPVAVHQNLEVRGTKSLAKLLSVPAPEIKASGIKPNKFWDKTSYVLGCTADEKKLAAEECAATTTMAGWVATMMAGRIGCLD